MTADKRSAFSVLEAIIVVTFIAVIAAIAVPRLNFGIISKQKAECVARKIVTDLRRTRQHAITNAANNPEGYALNMIGSAPYGGYQIVRLGTSDTLDSCTIESRVSCKGGSSFQFGPLGNLKDGSSAELTVESGGRTFRISVVSATGAIKCVEN